mgnify:CR=1 FL=1
MVHCCVVNCHKKWSKDSDVTFYRFPLLRNPAQADLWRKRVGRKNPDGTDWQPNSNSMICSLHFVTGKYSRSRDDPDYAPSIFSTNHVRKRTANDCARFQRVS